MIGDCGSKCQETAIAQAARRVAWVFVFGLLALVGCGGGEQGKPERAEPVVSCGTDLILVSQESPWLVAAAAPLVARLRCDGPLPMLAVVGSPPGETMSAMLRRIEAKQCWLLGPAPNREADGVVRCLKPSVLATGVDPVDGSFLIAEKFWPKCAEAVAARDGDSGGLILAAALAARKAVPLLICESSGDGGRFAKRLRKQGVKRLLFISMDTGSDRNWGKRLGARVEVIDAAEAQRQLAAAAAGGPCRTMILTREPAADGKVGATAWLAPYLSVLRDAPLVIVPTDDAQAAETEVFRRIDELHACPQTLTILADYKAIGTKRTVVGSAPAKPSKPRSKKDPPYTIDVEPCIPVDFGGVVRLGVGRIPLATLEDASALVLRSAARASLVGDEPVRLLMAANSRPDAYPLPLCETVSRLTAEEFVNCGAAVDAFYGTRADSPPALRAMHEANIILFEGHTLYQELFPASHDPDEDPVDEEPVEEEPGVDSEDLDTIGRLPNGTAVSLVPGAPELPSLRPRVGELAGVPIVILQSCHSLKPEVFARVHLQGGAALLGATTPVHSGSGSAWAKTFCDSLLYRNATLGQALRDAQNFLICLQELRGKRNHNELVKIQRVALSFRLWGDPEQCAWDDMHPRIDPAAAQWSASGTLEMHLPEARLPAVVTPNYAAAMFPGGEVAGIVQRLKDSTARRLSPVYFFRLPLPEGVDPRIPEALRDRVVIRIDREARLAYLVVMPQRERPGMRMELPLGPERGKTKR